MEVAVIASTKSALHFGKWNCKPMNFWIGGCDMHPNPLVELLARKCDEIGKGIPHQAWDCAEAIRATTQAEIDEVMGEIHVVFDGPPSHEGGRFVECENAGGCGINAGQWEQRGKYWHLIINAAPAALPEREVTETEHAILKKALMKSVTVVHPAALPDKEGEAVGLVNPDTGIGVATGAQACHVAPAALPEGYVMVPKEPNAGMFVNPPTAEEIKTDDEWNKFDPYDLSARNEEIK